MSNQMLTRDMDQQTPQGEIILYQPDETIRLEVRLEDDTVWLNRQQLAQLFGRDVKTIGKHIGNALQEELSKVPTVAKFAIVQKEGNRQVKRLVEFYSLDMVISVGYRVKSEKGIEFRIYLIDLASSYLTEEYGKGFSTTSLRNYRQFYQMFRNMIPDSPDASGESSLVKIYQTRLANLSWSHYEQLIRVKDSDARSWYMTEAKTENWSVRTLHRNISSQYYYRLLQTPDANRQEVINEMKQKTALFQRDKLEIMKNPIVAEFLGLSQNPSFSETKLESAIIEHLKDFFPRRKSFSPRLNVRNTFSSFSKERKRNNIILNQL